MIDCQAICFRESDNLRCILFGEQVFDVAGCIQAARWTPGLKRMDALQWLVRAIRHNMIR
jgi:hypothetical protein